MKTTRIDRVGLNVNVVGMPFAAIMNPTVEGWTAIHETPEVEDTDTTPRVRFYNRAGFYGVATWLTTVIVALVVLL